MTVACDYHTDKLGGPDPRCERCQQAKHRSTHYDIPRDAPIFKEDGDEHQ